MQMIVVFLGFLILEELTNNKIKITIEGALLPSCYENMSVNWMYIWVQLVVMKKPVTKFKPSNIRLIQVKTDLSDRATIAQLYILEHF
jgi:hypothetical protein